MQQTLFVLGSLLIIMIITVNQQRSIFMFQRNAYIREIESVAADFAKQQLEAISNSVGFDEARLGTVNFTTTTSDLTSVGSLGPDGAETAGSFDDLDDFDGHTETIFHIVSQDTFRFQATYSVQYVDPSNPSNTVTSPTLAKEIVATVISLNPIGAMTANVTFSKTMIAADYF